jgi:Predicted integral membrane protein
VRMSFTIAQPVERVFAFCSDFENFPLLVGALREVRDYGDGRSHWCGSTPSGRSVEWDTIVTKYVPNSVVGWQSVGRSSVKSSGVIRVRPEAGGTCLQIVLSYRVLDSRLRDSLAALVTRPLVEQLERDVARLGSYLKETGARNETA